jgi:hypothetical protein
MCIESVREYRAFCQYAAGKYNQRRRASMENLHFADGIHA